MRSNKLWLFVGVLVLAVAGGAFWFLQGDENGAGSPGGGGARPDSEETVSLTEEEVLERAPAIFYTEGNVLKAIEAGQSDGEVVREGINAGAIGRGDLSFVTWLAFAGDEARIQIYDRTADEIDAVTGTTPLWDQAGRRLAYVAPLVLGDKCDEDGCEGDVQVVVLDAESGERSTWLSQGNWQLIGWAGDELLVGDKDAKDEAVFVDADGENRRIEIGYEEIKSVSPDGKWVIRSLESGPELVGVEDNIDRWPLGVEDDTITSVDWLSDSSRAVVVASTDDEPPRLFILDTEAHSLEVFNDVEVVGHVFLTGDEDGLVATVVDRDEPQLEASYCPLEAPDTCVSLLEWQIGIRIVGSSDADIQEGDSAAEATMTPDATSDPDETDAPGSTGAPTGSP